MTASFLASGNTLYAGILYEFWGANRNFDLRMSLRKSSTNHGGKHGLYIHEPSVVRGRDLKQYAVARVQSRGSDSYGNSTVSRIDLRHQQSHTHLNDEPSISRRITFSPGNRY